jgi:hypothetical protein
MNRGRPGRVRMRRQESDLREKPAATRRIQIRSLERVSEGTGQAVQGRQIPIDECVRGAQERVQAFTFQRHT